MKKYYEDWKNHAKNLDLDAEVIEIDDKVKTLETFAFQDCKNVKKIIIGKGVKTIENGAFSRCSSLREVEVDPKNKCFYSEDNSLLSADTHELILCFGEAKICDSAQSVDLSSAFTFDGVCKDFYIGKSLKKIDRAGNYFQIDRITLSPENEYFELRGNCVFEKGKNDLILGCTQSIIPEGTEKICSEAFFGSLIEKITVPSSVRIIDRKAFDRCLNLKEVIFEEGIESIGEYAFSYNNLLKEITLPKSLKEVGGYAFEHCEALEAVHSFGSIKKISDSMFVFCKNLKNITISGTVKTIERCAFFSCYALKNVCIENGVKSIGHSAFGYCTSLEEITMADSVTELDCDCFGSCKKLKTIKLSENIKTIPMRAFSQCNALKEIHLPESVKKLDTIAFQDCINLESINIENVTKSYRDTFEGCKKLPKEIKAPRKPPAAAKGMLPQEMFSYYDFEEIASNFDDGFEITLLRPTGSEVNVIISGIFDYDDDEYICVTYKDETYFVEIDYEMDETFDLYPAMVIGKGHPMYDELSNAFMLYQEGCLDEEDDIDDEDEDEE